ncbi:MAG: valine--tRNA ligase [Spirochaetaceae bacterium]|nr:MAG: valine--tRNA ligase [Spirochaetaceae bacterium]
MKAIELAKTFDHNDFEDRIYAYWKESGYFAPPEPHGIPADEKPFVIVIPPPNVTGVLHMGHGLNNSLQDVLIRYYRMLGRPTLWVPGTDHAGIATQNVVERQLRDRGTSRRDLGRERFVEETWKVKDEHHAIITRQLEKIGASCDWSRERFTLDEGLSRAVREVFVTLYERGLVYRGNYLVNWCSSCGTALSDDEVEYVDVNGRMYHYYYPLADGSGKVEIATTRPETMLGDTGLAVNPRDERYSALVGKTAILPLVNREIPIVADSYVEMEFGTGVVKVTPGHDINDWEIGRRHQLQVISILNPDGTLNQNVPQPYRGLSALEARKAVVRDVKQAGLFIRDEEHSHQIGHCYRCQTRIEPFLSDQWFVRMKPLAEKALGAWRRGEVMFYPPRWENTYTNWLENIRDWCISRQLWWGHRIPVWYDDETGEMIVSRTDPTEDPAYAGRNLRQDEDVLDTWFSSWLWPFSTLGWPEQTADLRTFYPTTTLVTAYDIIFFWVARMIMAGMEFMNEAPFRDIYITGLIRDKQGRKMSKSLGNGMDPLDIVHRFGADALKFTLSFLAAKGQDILLDEDDFHFGSKFANKIWNASRYLLMNLEGRTLLAPDRIELKPIDRWILHRLNGAIAEVRRAMDAYRFNDATSAGYEFFWNDFCDWYIEASKISLYSDNDAEKDRAASLLVYVLEESLRLLHPFLSFITEEIYQKLPEFPEARSQSIIVADYPVERPERDAPQVGRDFDVLQELVRAVRTLRSEFTIPPATRIRFHVRSEPGFASTGFLIEHSALITLLTTAQDVTFSGSAPDAEGSVAVVGTGFEVYVFIRDAIDVAAEIARLRKSIEKLQKALDASQKKLASDGFLQKAGEQIVQKEREKRDELARRISKMQGYMAELGG